WFSKQDQETLYKFNPVEKKLDSFNHNSGLLNRDIWWMHEDAKGIIWICGTQGLEAYDSSTGKIISHLKEYSNGIGMIYEDHNGLWLADYGLKLFDPVKKQLLQNYQHQENDTSSISSSVVLYICPGANGLLWI